MTLEHIHQLPATILAVTKYATLEQMHHLYTAGFHEFGQSKVQDTITKKPHFPNATWHMIGHLQTNKVAKAIDLFNQIDSVDSLKLCQKLNTSCQAKQTTMPILFQLNLTGESQKYGFSADEFQEALPLMMSCSNLSPRGLMIMGPNTSKSDHIHQVFEKAKRIHTAAMENYPQLKTLSMGMSQDYAIALEHGATQLRLGSLLLNCV